MRFLIIIPIQYLAYLNLYHFIQRIRSSSLFSSDNLVLMDSTYFFFTGSVRLYKELGETGGSNCKWATTLFGERKTLLRSWTLCLLLFLPNRISYLAHYLYHKPSVAAVSPWFEIQTSPYFPFACISLQWDWFSLAHATLFIYYKHFS